MQKGDVILIVFPFTDLSGNKLRPALVLAETTDDLTVMFITTQLKWQENIDVVLRPDDNNGIKKESLLRISKIATLDKSLVKGRLGAVSFNILNEINTNLKKYFNLQ